MLSSQITVQDIDFEKTLNCIFPMLYYHMITSDSQSYLIRLFQKLGQNSLPVCREILRRLSPEDKNELVVLLVNARPVLARDAINEHLHSDSLGKYASIGSISAQIYAGKIAVFVDEICLDYAGLMNESQIQKAISTQMGTLYGFARSAAKVAVSTAPDWLVRKGIQLIQQPSARNRLIAFLESNLHRKGIELKISDISLLQEVSIDKDSVNSRVKCSRQLEEHLLSAIADLLNSSFHSS